MNAPLRIRCVPAWVLPHRRPANTTSIPLLSINRRWPGECGGWSMNLAIVSPFEGQFGWHSLVRAFLVAVGFEQEDDTGDLTALHLPS